MIKLRLCRDEVERNGEMRTEQFCSDGAGRGALAVRYGRVLCVRVWPPAVSARICAPRGRRTGCNASSRWDHGT